MSKQEKSCGTCEFNVNEHCRRYPPQVTATAGADDVYYAHSFPEVYDSDWCGEWQPKEVK